MSTDREQEQAVGYADCRQPAITAARELSEVEGWDATTPRRLAERIECDQAVLYRYFPSKEAIVAAAAVEGFAELATKVATARTAAPEPTLAWAAVVDTYLEFAYAHPALYEAMFTLTPDLPFTDPGPPTALRAAFAELRDALAPLAYGRDLDALTEVAWSALHGMVMLTRGGRLRPELQERREAILAGQVLGLVLPQPRAT